MSETLEKLSAKDIYFMYETKSPKVSERKNYEREKVRGGSKRKNKKKQKKPTI